MARLAFCPQYLKGKDCGAVEDIMTPKKEVQVFHMEGARTRWPVPEFKECSNMCVNLLLLKVVSCVPAS